MNNQEKDQIKVLIATGIYPPDLGGPATLLTALPSSLKEKGVAVKILTYSDVSLSEQERQEKMLWRVKRQQNSLCRKVNYFWRMWRLSCWADLNYVTDTYSVGYFAYLIKRLTGKKYILRFAGDSAWETAVAKGWTNDYIVDFQKKRYDSRTEKLKRRRAKILLGAERVIAVSEFLAGVARAIGVASEKIRVIYNAVDFFGAAPSKEEPLSPVLVFAGRLMPWKGVAMLLSAVAKLKKSWPDIVLEILGDGPEEEPLKKMAQDLGLEKNVIFHGRVSEPASHKVFARSTIFVLNTNYEGLPHSVLNAMAGNLPVITTPIGGNLEVVQDGVNGLLAPYNDETAWQAAISRLLADKALRQQLVINAKKTIEKFKWETLVRQTIAVLKELKDQ